MGHPYVSAYHNERKRYSKNHEIGITYMEEFVMQTAIVYYSLEGNTEYAARAIAAELGADTLRINPKKSYPSGGFRKFLWGGKSAVMAEAPELEPYEFDSAKYDRIVFGFPVWAGTVTPPIRTFVQENDLREKRVAAFACQSGNGAQKAFAALRKCLGRDALEDELVLIDPKDKPSAENEERLRAFCERLNAAEVS